MYQQRIFIMAFVIEKCNLFSWGKKKIKNPENQTNSSYMFTK